MALVEYAKALRAFAFAGNGAKPRPRGELYRADILLELFGLKNDPRRVDVMKAIWSGAGHSLVFEDLTIENDTEVFNPSDGCIWKGTRKVIHDKGLSIVPDSQDFVPHQWLNEEGFVDPELARQHPYPHQVA